MGLFTFFKNLKHKWKYRHETPEQRKQRVMESRLRWRQLYEAEKKSWEAYPDSRELRNARAIMDQLMDELLGEYDNGHSGQRS